MQIIDIKQLLLKIKETMKQLQILAYVHAHVTAISCYLQVLRRTDQQQTYVLHAVVVVVVAVHGYVGALRRHELAVVWRRLEERQGEVYL